MTRLFPPSNLSRLLRHFISTLRFPGIERTLWLAPPSRSPLLIGFDGRHAAFVTPFDILDGRIH